MRMLLKDLSPGTKYYLQARTFSDSEGAKSEWSRKFEVDTPVDTMAPQAPASPVITLSGTEGILSWSPVTTNADGSPITDLAGYKVTVKSPGTSNTYVKNVGLATNMEFSLDTNRKAFGSPRGQLYFDVVAIDSVGNESSVSTSPTVSTPPPANVTGLSSSGLQSAISLTWDALTSPLVVGYKVYMGTTAGFTLDTPVAEVKTNAHIQSTTMYSTDHYFKVVAVDAFGVVSAVPASTGPIRPTSPFALDTTAPAVPTGLTAVISNNTMKVSWNAVSDTDLRYYIVSYRPAGTTEWATTNVPHDQTSTVIPVPTGVNYNVRVRTSDIMSNMSNESSIITTTTATVNTAPAVPTGLAVVAGKDDLQISWSENAEADMKNNLGTYDVTVATNSGFTTEVLQYRTGATTLSINGLSTATQYWVRVRATDSGNPPLSSEYSASVTATTSSFPTTPLSDGVAPASSPVASVTGGFRYIHASWTPIANNDTVTYEVHLGTTTGFTPSASTKVGEIAGSTIIIETTGAGASLAYNTNYYVKTIAKDRDGAAAASAASSAVQITKVASTDTTITPGQIGAATPSDVQGAKDYTDTKYSSALKGSVVEYAVNSSESTAPTTGWSSSTPTRTPGTFVWFRTVLTYGDNTTTTTSPALLTGNTGATGSTGAPAQYITLTATTQVLSSPSAGGTTNPATSVVTGTATNTTISVWEYSVNGAAFSATVPAGVTRSGNIVTITGATMTAKTITVRMTNGSTASDTITVARVFDGADGAAGTPGVKGDPGAPGAPGAAGADAYTVLLTNEAQTFAGSTTAALAGSASTAVIAYKGATQTAATIGTITGQVTGLTTAITNNGTNNATVTVTVTTSLTALSGVLTIPVTVDGKTFTKTFSWSVSRQGVQGSQGIPGVPGADGQVFYTWLKYADTPTTGMSDLPDGKTYMGIAYNKTTETESSNYADYTWSLIKGADGASGKGITGTTVTYQTHSNGTTAPTGTWQTAPTTTTPGQFLWTRTVTTYTDSTTSTAYSVSAHGATGSAGKGVSSTSVTYQVHTNGTSAPTGTWLSTIPATSPGQFLWTRTITNYTDSTSVTAYSVAAHGTAGSQGIPGTPGADGQPTYTWIKYGTSAAGAGISDDPTGKTYIGIAYNKLTQTESSTPGDYEWSLIQGPKGDQGDQGVAGAPAKVVSLTATTQVLTSPAGGGATSPATAVVTGTAVNTTITSWTYSSNGAAFTTTLPAGVTRSGNVVTITGSTVTAKTITVRMADADGNADTLTVAKVFDGATGATGTPGAPGADGATGPAGADAYTVLLSNEAQVFAGSTTSALAGSTTTSVIAYKGSTQSVASIGTITGQVTGLTTSITNNGTNSPTVTVNVTTALTALNGVLTIPVTVDGKVFTKTFSWSVSRQGVQGIKGDPGADGVTTYTWLKYADTPTTGMSDSPTGKTYMGLATNKTTPTQSSVYSDYTWSLIKGADGSPGVPGAPGADGTTTYTWVKYATSAAGAGMSDDPTGKTYIGLAFNKTTATESTTPGDYQWSLIQGPQGETGNTGAPGAPAEMVYLTSTTQVLTSPAAGGATNPTTAVVTGASVNGTITVWQYSTNGAAFTTTLPTGVTRSGNVVTITGSTMTANTITVRMATASGVSDTLTVAKVYDGATGATGTPGAPGAAGSDAYTVILSNEAHSFAGSTSAALAGSTTSTVIAYKGATQQSATVGTITGQATGLTTSVASNSTTAPVITITVTTALTTRNGTLTVPVTVDGKTFTKTIAWSVAYTGATGSTGAPGANGVSVTSVTPYYQTVTKGAAAPATPTASPPPAPWGVTEPSYTANTELYRTDRVVYSNSTFSYSPVTKVASYSGLEAVTADAQVKADAAKDAAILAASLDATSKANTAQTSANAYTDSAKTALQGEISSARAAALDAARSATNLVLNPGFENGNENWVGSFPTVVEGAANSRSGMKALRFPAGTGEIVSDPIPVTPGAPLRVELWARGNASGGSAGLRLQKSTNGTSWSSVSPGQAGWVDQNVIHSLSGWQLLTSDYGGDDSIRYVRVRIATASLTGSVDFDDVSVKDLSESKRLEAYANEVENRALSRGTDLVTNGTGYLKNNYNFPGFTFMGTDAPVGANGSFYYNSAAQGGTFISESIPYDPTKSYQLSFSARQVNEGATTRMYGMITPLDSAGLIISPYHYMYISGTTTTLAQPLNPGDTTITLTSSSNWYGQSGKAAGASTHLRSIIWWDYTDSLGKTWETGTYSRNTSGSNYWADGGISGNVITLSSPYTGPAKPAGTALSNGTSGGNYIYMPSVNNVVVPPTWTAFKDILKAGTMPPWAQAVASTGAATWSSGVPSATASIKIGWLMNYPASPANATVGKQAIAAVSFSDASAANYAANNITSTQITDGAIITPKIATDAIDARTVSAGAIGTVALAAEAVDATKIKSNSINATHVAIGDTSNMATINESVAGTANYGYDHIITNGWSARTPNTSVYFMFRPATGPVPFKTGDRIRITFEAYASAAGSSTLGLWVYGNATLSQAIGTVVLTTTAQTFTFESDITVDTNLKTSYVMGLQGVASRDVFLRNVRAYRMGVGELIVDGSIHGDKITANTINGDRIITNTLDANAIKTSTLTSTVITLGAGGIIKTNTGGVQITDSGIIIPAGHLDANIIKADTSFVTTINVGAGGSIQSTGYSPTGTSGFSLSSTGLTIKGANNVVDASVIKGGTITGTTVNVGAGGTLNIDSTAQVKSNNYQANSTGYRLTDTALEINDGSIDAKTLRANSALINEIVIGTTPTGPGGIRSNDYVANSNGFKLSTAGLEINKGSIAAEALRLQVGRNQMHPAYADFEHDESFYAGKIANFFAIPMVSSEQAKFGSKSLKITWTGDSGSSVHLAASDSDWNVKFDPSKKQIVSMWVFIPDSYSVRMIIRYNQTNGVRGNILTPLVPTGTGWQRISYEWTPPALATGDALVGIVNGAGSLNKSMYVDAVQFEEKTGASSEPSTYFPPSTTTIDGGAIRTGSIRSSALNSRGEPYWSINMSGNAVFNRALVQEELIVGDPSSASKYASIKSVNYTAGTSGWIIDSSGKFEANDGTFRGKIMASSLEASMNIAGNGVIISGTPTGARVEQSSQGIKVFALGYNNEPYEAVSMINGKTSFSVVNQTVGVAAGISSEGEVTGQTGSFKNNLYFKGVDVAGTLSGSPVTGWMDLLARGIVPGGLSTSTTLGTATSAETRGITVRGMVYAGRRYRIRASWLGKLSSGSGVVRLRIRYTYDGSLPTTSSPAGGATPTFPAYSSSVSVGGDVETILTPSTDSQLTAILTHHGLAGATAQKEWSQIYIEDIGPKNLEFSDAEDGDVKTLYTTSWKATQSAGYSKGGGRISRKNNQIDLWYFGNSEAEQAIALFGGTAMTTDNQSEVGRTMPQALNGATIHKVTLEITNAMWWDKNVRNMAFGALAGSALPAEKVVEGTKVVSNIAEGSTISVDLTASDFTNGTAQMVTIGNRNASVNGATMGSGRFQGPADASPPVLTVVYSR